MLDFFKTNWLPVLIALIFTGYVVYLVVTKNWPGLRGLAYKIMLQAERVFAAKDGTDRLNFVLGSIYNKYPWIWLILDEDTLKAKLQKWYNIAKDELDDGQINGSINNQSPGSSTIENLTKPYEKIDQQNKDTSPECFIKETLVDKSGVKVAYLNKI